MLDKVTGAQRLKDYANPQFQRGRARLTEAPWMIHQGVPAVPVRPRAHSAGAL